MRELFLTIMAVLLAGSTAAASGRQSVLIYPSGATIPENILRIELRFCAPLWPPLTVEQLKLYQANGSEIKDAFLDQPVVSADGKRVTVLFDPARLKSGVGANLAMGRAVHVGENVILVIEHPALTVPARKAWRVTTFDSRLPQPSHWTFETPTPGSRSPFVLHLDKAISSSAEGLIAIRAPDGARLAGEACLQNSETIWRFVPERPWQAGNYAVLTHPDLEDCAGNRVCGPFEGVHASQIADEKETIQPFQLRD